MNLWRISRMAYRSSPGINDISRCAACYRTNWIDSTRIDYARDMALIATVGSGHDERQGGMAYYVRDDVGLDCDIAIAISDAWQHHGIGEQLLRAILGIAAATGVRCARGMALWTNHGMIQLARKMGFLLQRDPKDATVTQLSKKL